MGNKPSVYQITRDDFRTGWDRLHATPRPPGLITADHIDTVRAARTQGDLLAFMVEVDFIAWARTVAPHVVTIDGDSFWSDRDAVLRSERLVRDYDGPVYVAYDLDADAVALLCVCETDAVALRLVLPPHVDDL